LDRNNSKKTGFLRFIRQKSVPLYAVSIRDEETITMIGRMIICCLLFSLNVAAQEQETTDSVSTQKSKSNLVDKLHQVQQYLDNKLRKKVDPLYIEVPEKPWRVVLRYNASVFDVDYSNSVFDPSTSEGIDWEMCFEPPMASSVGIWAGYRGTGIGFSKGLNKKKGTTFSFTTTGAKYGANIRLRSFDIDEVTLTSTVYEDGKEEHGEDKGRLGAPVSIASLYLNGYYVFNGRRYSQAAAYNQSVIQRRSAGSFLLGATWYMSAFDFSDDRNSAMILLSNNVGRIKLHQGNIGVGYGFNWVPLRGLVLNAMAMPTVSFYNRVKVYKYDCNYELVGAEGPTDDYGKWNPETHTWANGKTHRPFSNDENDDTWQYDIDSWENGSESEYSMFRFNLDLRIGIAYNWSDYFIGLRAQFNKFNYKKDQCKVNLYDAYARLSFGVRL
jgi:hypothetical protein